MADLFDDDEANDPRDLPDDPPDTLRNPDKFTDIMPAGFDGFFRWDWVIPPLRAALGNDYVSPMDIDGHLERFGHFLIFETKREGAPVPLGQQLALQNLWARGYVQLVYLWGKRLPMQAEIWYPAGNKGTLRERITRARIKKLDLENYFSYAQMVYDWACFANRNPCPFRYDGSLIRP